MLHERPLVARCLWPSQPYEGIETSQGEMNQGGFDGSLDVIQLVLSHKD